MKFLICTDEGALSLSKVTIVLQDENYRSVAEVLLQDLLGLDEREPMWSLAFTYLFQKRYEALYARECIQMAAEVFLSDEPAVKYPVKGDFENLGERIRKGKFDPT